MSTTNPKSCDCWRLVPYDKTYDLDRELERPSGRELLESLSRWDIRCRRCGRQWTGEWQEGGGVYGDSLWSETKSASSPRG